MIPSPRKHQIKSIVHADTTDEVFDISDPGTGKTAVRILVFAKRRKAKGGKLLVLAPRTLLRNVWFNDFKKFAPHLTVSVANADNRAAAFAAKADVYVTNVDAVKWLAQQKKPFFDQFSEIVVDESTCYKHHSSQRSKAAARIMKFFKHKALLTGTPNSNSITDVWHQVFLLDGGRRLGNSFYAFRNSVCTPVQVGRSAQMVQWQDREGAEEAVFGLISDIVVRHRFEDCVDIPPNHRYSVEFDMPPKQREAYEQLKATQMLWLKQTSPKATPAVLAINAAAVSTKLLQVASGAVYESPDKYHVIDTSRYELVLDKALECEHSLVIYQWKHQRDLLIAEAERRKIKFCVLDSKTSDIKREMYVAGYQKGFYRIMFGHPMNVAHGLTLTKGTRTVWASPTHDLEWFTQGSRRQYRMGQTKKTETVVIVAKDTYDERAYANLLGKNVRMTNLLDLFGQS